MRRFHIYARASAFALMLAAGLSLPAVAADTRPYAALHWRMIGPFRGGRALAVTGVPGSGSVFYFGAVAGGLWKTTDAGRTWKPIFDGQPIASIGAIAVAYSDPDVIYVGSGEADMRSDITYGNGMYKSVDAGKTWTHIGLDDTRQIGKIAVDPTDSKRVFVAALGHGYGPNAQRGVFRSLDGGRTWQRVLYKDSNTGAIDVILDPADPQTVYAALWQTRRPPWSVYPPSKGPGTGLYISHDGGTSWSHVTTSGFPPQGLGRMGIAVAPSDPKRVYVIATADKGGGLYRSDDGGATWQLVDADPRLWQRGWYFCTLAVNPKNPDLVYVSDTAFYRSTDGGRHFSAIKGSPDGDDFHQPWVDPTDGDRIILGSDQGATISLNGGLTWSSWFNQPTAQFYHIAADDRFPFHVFGAQQDSGAAMVATATDALGLTQFDWQMVAAGGESGYVAPDPRDPDVFFGDNVTREDLRSRQPRSVDPTLAHPDLWRSQWTLPLTFSRTDPHVLYYARQAIFRSADGGDSWRIISPDLTRPNPGAPPTSDAPTAADDGGVGPRRGVVYTIAPSPLRSGEIWAGTDDGKIWITRDEGGHWIDVTPPRVTAWSRVSLIEASAFDADTAYAAVDRHALDDLHPYIYRTRDGGRTWSPAADGIPAGAYVNAVREDPSRRGLLYAGTELGVYVSFDDGKHWESLRLNMPVVPVRDLVIRQDSLAIATHGRAFWVLDDLSVLHQRATHDGSAWLYAPETAVRVLPHFDAGERLPPEEPAGENRQTGAFVDYAVYAASEGPLILAVYDTSGALVRRYSSAEHPHPTDPNSIPFPAFWAPTPPALDAAPGTHRFVWNFAYALVPGEPDEGDGALAPPGRYVVRLSYGGRTWSQPLVVAKDPRTRASDADLLAQFKLARAIEQLRAATAQARSLAMRRHLTALAGGPPHANPETLFGMPPKELTSLWAVSNALGALEASVESADHAPSADERAAFAHWKAVLDADRARLTS